jgi:hypothetical protein
VKEGGVVERLEHSTGRGRGGAFALALGVALALLMWAAIGSLVFLLVS